MRINTNTALLNALEYYTLTNANLTESLERLSSGLRINKAADDASGLAIADKLRTQADSITQAIDNANSAVALTQIADKAMAEQSNILDMIKQKLIQASTSTTSTAGEYSIGTDINKLLDNIDSIAQETNYNGITLLQYDSNTKSATTSLTFQVGEASGDTIISEGGVNANVTGLTLHSLKSLVSANNMSQSAASLFLTTIDNALDTLNKWRSNFGSTQNQLESAIRNLATQVTNIKAAESVIRDIDYATESANFSKLSIISQAGSYAISQANALQQNVLRLLQY